MKLPEFWKTGVALPGPRRPRLVHLVRRAEAGAEAGGRAEKVTVLAVDKAKAKEISLAAGRRRRIRLVKERPGWQVVAPFAAPADTAAVESILTSLEKLEADEVVVEQPTSLAEFGLDTPSRTITAVVEGARRPADRRSSGRSARTARRLRPDRRPRRGSTLVPPGSRGTFDKKPFDLRDRDLLHVKRDDVRTLEVRGPEGGYALARTDAGEWAFTKPLATRAGRWSVDGLLGTLENLRMDSVAAEEAERPEALRPRQARPHGEPRARRRLDPDARDRAAARTHGHAPPRPPRREGEKPAPRSRRSTTRGRRAPAWWPWCPATLVDDLAKGMGELRAKRLLEVATYDIEGFDVVAGGATKTYAKSTTKDKDGFDKTQWKRTAPDAKDLETTKVEDALFKMGGVEVSEFVDEPQRARGLRPRRPGRSR